MTPSVSDYVINYDGQATSMVSTMALPDGKVAHHTQYFAGPSHLPGGGNAPSNEVQPAPDPVKMITTQKVMRSPTAVRPEPAGQRPTEQQTAWSEWVDHPMRNQRLGLIPSGTHPSRR